jgi:hypothetical protein
MTILKISEEKLGPSSVINIDTTLDHTPNFPSLCPCCVELVDKGAFLVAACEHLPPVYFPACKVCARHTAFFSRVSRVMGTAFLILTVLTVAGVLFYRGMDGVEESGGGFWWQVFGGISNLLFPFMSPINALVTFLGGALVLLVYAFVYWVAMAPVSFLLCKPSCKWFNQAARTSRGYSSEAGGHVRRFIFENPKYAVHFRRANRSVADVAGIVKGA